LILDVSLNAMKQANQDFVNCCTTGP